MLANRDLEIPEAKDNPDKHNEFIKGDEIPIDEIETVELLQKCLKILELMHSPYSKQLSTPLGKSEGSSKTGEFELCHNYR